jgi:hypothetical protein
VKNKNSQQVTTGTDQKAEESQKPAAASSTNDSDNQPKDFTSLLEASLRNQLSTFTQTHNLSPSSPNNNTTTTTTTI